VQYWIVATVCSNYK